MLSWQLVKDSAGTIHLTPAGTPVGYGVASQPLPAAPFGQFMSELQAGLHRLGADTGQVNTIFGAVLQSGAPSTIAAKRGGGYVPTTADTVTTIGIGGLFGGIAGALGDLGSVADPFTPGQTTANAPRAGEPGSPTEGDASSQDATGKAAGGAGAGLAAKGLAGLLGATGLVEFGVRALEALGGAALILLGLQALTGGSGNPVSQTKRAARTVAKVVR